MKAALMSWFSARRAALVSLVRRLGARAYLLFALVFTTLIVTDLGLLNLVAAADTRLFDTMISNRVIVPSPDPDIVILDIDEASLAGMAREHGRWPWPNRVLGEVVRGIEAQQPRAIVFDILFSDADVQRPESDAAFNAEIARSTRTFFPMLRLDPQNDKLSRIPVGALPGARALQAQADAQAPIAIILPRVPAALDNGRLGTHQVTPDKDGIIRRYPAWIEHAGWRIPSLPQRIAEEYGDPGSDQAEVLINWRGKPFTYPYISFVDVYRDLKAEKKERALSPDPHPHRDVRHGLRRHPGHAAGAGLCGGQPDGLVPRRLGSAVAGLVVLRSRACLLRPVAQLAGQRTGAGHGQPAPRRTPAGGDGRAAGGLQRCRAATPQGGSR
ncbi:MAG: CHASE2 domain-containing protein [Curvibacter sp.]